MSKELLQIKNLYANAETKEILKGLNLTVNKGEVHALTLIMRHYHPEHTDFNPAAIPRTRVLKLEVTSMTGKRRMTSAK